MRAEQTNGGGMEEARRARGQQVGRERGSKEGLDRGSKGWMKSGRKVARQREEGWEKGRGTRRWREGKGGRKGGRVRGKE